MEERKNLNLEDVLELISENELQATFSDVYVTVNTDEEDGMLVLANNTMSEYQYIVSKGPHVNFFKEGDLVLLNLEKMITKERNPNNQDEFIEALKVDPIYCNGIMLARVPDRLIVGVYKTKEVKING